MQGSKLDSLPFSDFPSSLRCLLHSAETESPYGADGLAAFIELALRKVPARGILDPGVQGAIDAIARGHFELDGALADLRQALEAADLPTKPRDHIESAARRVQATSETAHFYAGLAFGLVYAGPHGGSQHRCGCARCGDDTRLPNPSN